MNREKVIEWLRENTTREQWGDINTLFFINTPSELCMNWTTSRCEDNLGVFVEPSRCSQASYESPIHFSDVWDQPVFIDGAEYLLKDSSGHGDATRVRYLIGTNTFYEVGKPFGFSAPARDFGKHFTVELVTKGPTPPNLYERIKKVLGERDVPIGGEDHLVGQVTVDHQKAAILDKVIKEFKIPVGGDVIKWLHNRTGTVEKAARQLVLNSFEYQGPNYDTSLMNKAFNELTGVLGIECKYDNPNPDSIKSLVPGRQHPRNKYDREILPGIHVDIYDVLAAFTTNSAAIDHAVKKLLAPGQRGVKDRVTDLKEAVSSIQREIDRIGEWSVGEDSEQ